MSDNKRAKAYQKLSEAVTGIIPEVFVEKTFPIARLEFSFQALHGAATPPPPEAGPMLPTNLRGGVYKVALAADGTIAATGLTDINKDVYLIVFKPERSIPQLIDVAPVISHLFFPEGSNQPAYLRVRDTGEVEWVWNGLTLPSDQNDRNTRPLFWMCDDVPTGAIITDSTLYTQCQGDEPNKIIPARADDERIKLIPHQIKLIAGRLLTVWQHPNNPKFSRVTWNDNTVKSHAISIRSITEGPDGQPYFLAQHDKCNSTNPFNMTSLFNMSGEVRSIDHEPERVWTAPGQIFTLEWDSLITNADHCIREVISEWGPKDCNDSVIEFVGSLGGETGDVIVYESGAGYLFHVSRESLIILGRHHVSSRSTVRVFNNLLVQKSDQWFQFIQDTGQEEASRLTVPNHDVRLKDLVLMDDGSIQAVAKIGTAVVTYKFYEPNV